MGAKAVAGDARALRLRGFRTERRFAEVGWWQDQHGETKDRDGDFDAAVCGNAGAEPMYVCNCCATLVFLVFLVFSLNVNV